MKAQIEDDSVTQVMAFQRRSESREVSNIDTFFDCCPAWKTSGTLIFLFFSVMLWISGHVKLQKKFGVGATKHDMQIDVLSDGRSASFCHVERCKNLCVLQYAKYQLFDDRNCDLHRSNASKIAISFILS